MQFREGQFDSSVIRP
nr:unnamed protein product [Callosobruchus chinensis]